jgi:hypothetical protein
MTNQTLKIRELNDKFRRGDKSVPGQIVMTRGIADLLEENETAREDLIYQIRSYDSFTEDNDPHGEHDFGSFELSGYPCFWKLDCYDPTLKWGSEDASDPIKTTRVLTIMLVEEY